MSESEKTGGAKVVEVEFPSMSGEAGLALAAAAAGMSIKLGMLGYEAVAQQLEEQSEATRKAVMGNGHEPGPAAMAAMKHVASDVKDAVSEFFGGLSGKGDAEKPELPEGAVHLELVLHHETALLLASGAEAMERKVAKVEHEDGERVRRNLRNLGATLRDAAVDKGAPGPVAIEVAKQVIDELAQKVSKSDG